VAAVCRAGSNDAPADAVLMYANFNTFSFQTFRGPLPLLYMLMFYRIVDKLPADWLFDPTRAEQIAEQYVKLRDDLQSMACSWR
jgi:hypothetical protein